MENSTFDIMGVAKRVNSQIRRRRAARVVGGVALASLGMLRSGALAPLFVLGGAALVLRGVTDKPLAESWRRVQHWLQRPNTHRFGEGKRDLVDEASWQSFPASDPPGYSTGRPALAR